MNPIFAVPLAALVGLPLGFVFQRSHLCFNSAYRELLLHRRTVLLRMILLAVLVQMVILAMFFQLQVGGLQLNVVPFFWQGNVIGGLIFGFAMVYAEGCSSTVWYRVGNGNLGALVTLLGFALGEWALRYTPLRRFLDMVYAQALPIGPPATLPGSLGIHPLWIIIPTTIGLGWWLRQGKSGSYLNGWDWRLSGLVLGLLNVAVWLAGRPAGWFYGLGVVGASAEWIQAIFSGPSVLNFGSWVLMMLPLGALAAALRNGEFRWQIPDLSSSLRMLIAGLVMGLSATIAGGCNIGHGFSGLPLLALSSLTATLFTFLGAWAGNWLRFARAGLQP